MRGLMRRQRGRHHVATDSDVADCHTGSRSEPPPLQEDSALSSIGPSRQPLRTADTRTARGNWSNQGARRRLAFRDEFGRLEEEGEFLNSISPIKVVDSFKAPLFVYQGENDPRVPRSEQDQLVRALRKRGLTVEYMVAPDEGHSLNHRHNKLEFVGRISRFMDQVLERPGVPEGCRP